MIQFSTAVQSISKGNGRTSQGSCQFENGYSHNANVLCYQVRAVKCKVSIHMWMLCSGRIGIKCDMSLCFSSSLSLRQLSLLNILHNLH